MAITVNNASKWAVTIKTSWGNLLTYRLNFFLQVIGPSLVFFFIKYNLWSAIYSTHPGQLIRGMSFEAMMNYHVWALITSLLYRGHTSHNLSEDVRLGRISTYLIYPFNFWEHQTCQFLAFSTLQMVVATATFLILLALGLALVPTLGSLILGLFFGMLAGILWFTIQYCAGLMAFWLEETWMVRVVIELIINFLSGNIFPLDLYPEKLVTLLRYSPFPYLTYHPVKTFMGQTSEILLPFLIMIFWIGVFGSLANLLWKRGLRHYTGAGM